MKVRTAAAAIAAFASLASFAAVTHAASLAPNTTLPDSHAHAIGPRDPYTDGGKASKFDVYADAAKITDPRDPYTDGAHD